MAADESLERPTINGSDGVALLRAIKQITSWKHGESVTLNGSVVRGTEVKSVKFKATMIDAEDGRTVILDYLKPDPS